MKILVYAKCNDCCFVSVIDDDGTVLRDHDGYVPKIISNDSDGLDLEIDIKTGQILNWRAPSDDEIKSFINQEEFWPK